MISTLALPQRLVGETSTRNGEMSPASAVQAWSVHKANASPAPSGARCIGEIPSDVVKKLRAGNLSVPGFHIPMRQRGFCFLSFRPRDPHQLVQDRSTDTELLSRAQAPLLVKKRRQFRKLLD